jgi:hypothetical protein
MYGIAVDTRPNHSARRPSPAGDEAHQVCPYLGDAADKPCRNRVPARTISPRPGGSWLGDAPSKDGSEVAIRTGNQRRDW